MLFGVPVDRLFELLFAHRRQDDVLQDDRMAANTSYYAVRIYLIVHTNTADNVGHDIKLHDLSIDDRIAGQVFKAETNQVKVIQLTLELDHLCRTGTDI